MTLVKPVPWDSWGLNETAPDFKITKQTTSTESSTYLGSVFTGGSHDVFDDTWLDGLDRFLDEFIVNVFLNERSWTGAAYLTLVGHDGIEGSLASHVHWKETQLLGQDRPTTRKPWYPGQIWPAKCFQVPATSSLEQFLDTMVDTTSILIPIKALQPGSFGRLTGVIYTFYAISNSCINN